MRYNFGILAALLLLAASIYAQTPTEICESTVKIEKQATYEYLCGLADGDQLLFSFNSEKGGKIDRVEILEHPASIRFSDYKTASIKDKRISVTHSGIYTFRFYNDDSKAKIIKYHISRIPAGENTQHFNSTVYWKEVNDTTDIHTENQTIITTDTLISNLIDRVVNIHAWLSTQNNTTSIKYSLPPRTIAYSYYIGVNQAGNKIFSDASASLLRSCSPLVAAIPGYGPLAALALNGTSFLTALPGGESVEYWITDTVNAQLFLNGKPFSYIRQANVVNDFSRLTSPVNGNYSICLKNNNKLQSIDVTIKLTAISLHSKKTIRPVKKYTITTRRIPYLKN